MNGDGMGFPRHCNDARRGATIGTEDCMRILMMAVVMMTAACEPVPAGRPPQWRHSTAQPGGMEALGAGAAGLGNRAAPAVSPDATPVPKCTTTAPSVLPLTAGRVVAGVGVSDRDLYIASIKVFYRMKMEVPFRDADAMIVRSSWTRVGGVIVTCPGDLADVAEDREISWSVAVERGEVTVTPECRSRMLFVGATDESWSVCNSADIATVGLAQQFADIAGGEAWLSAWNQADDAMRRRMKAERDAHGH